MKSVVLILCLILCGATSTLGQTGYPPALPDSGDVQARIKDVAKVVGIRGNQLVGYGLVVGLDGTGDDQDFTFQSVKNNVGAIQYYRRFK